MHQISPNPDPNPDPNPSPSPSPSPSPYPNPNPNQVGDRVLARDRRGFWCAAKVLEALQSQP